MSACADGKCEAACQESKKFPQYLATILANLGAVAIGCYLSWSSPAFRLFPNGNSTLIVSANETEVSSFSSIHDENENFAMTGNEEAWVASIINLGALVGALPAGALAQTLGRKKSILINGLFLFLLWFVIGFAPSVLWLYAARFLAGCTIGATSVVVPMYVSEIAELKIRGSLGGMFQLHITIGILFEYITGFTKNLHHIALLSASVPAILLISFLFMPESPTWLISRGRRAEAEAALRQLRGGKYQTQKEMNQLELNLKSRKADAGILELKHYLKTLMIVLGLMAGQQLSGVNAVIFYAEDILKSNGATVVIAVLQVVFTCLSTILIERTGRKVLLLFSSSVMAVCLFSLAGYCYLKESYGQSSFGWIPVVSLAIYIVVFSLGFGPVPWLMVGDICPNNIKGIISSISAAFNWSLAFTVTMGFPHMKSVMGEAWVFVAFSLVCIATTVFVAIFVPESKGKTAEEVQNELRGIHKKKGKESKGQALNQTDLEHGSENIYSLYLQPPKSIVSESTAF